MDLVDCERDLYVKDYIDALYGGSYILSVVHEGAGTLLKWEEIVGGV